MTAVVVGFGGFGGFGGAWSWTPPPSLLLYSRFLRSLGVDFGPARLRFGIFDF